MEIQSEKKKKLLYVITKSNFGGAQKYVFELAKEMTKRDFEVAVALGGNGILREKLENSGIRVISIKSMQRDVNFASEIKAFFELIKIFRSEKPDIIHLNSSKAGALGALAGRLVGIKNIIFTIHGWAFNEKRPWYQRVMIIKIYWWTILLSHTSIAVSKITQEQAMKIPFFKLLNNKIRVIQNAIPPITFYTKEHSRNFFSEKIRRINNETKIIGTIAELHKIKGLEYLIQSAEIITKENKNVVFLIIGEGEERKNLENQISRSSLDEQAFLLGHIKDASLYMKGLDIFVLPSLYESFGLVLLEALQAEIPIIASRVGGIKELSLKYDFETFEPTNIRDMVNKITKSIRGESAPKIKMNPEQLFIKFISETKRIYNN